MDSSSVPHRPRSSETRPHTVHAQSSASSSSAPSAFVVDDRDPSDGETTPRASGFGRIAYPDPPLKRVSRDDTAADMHVLAARPTDFTTSGSEFPSTAAARFQTLPDQARLDYLTAPRRVVSEGVRTHLASSIAEENLPATAATVAASATEDSQFAQPRPVIRTSRRTSGVRYLSGTYSSFSSTSSASSSSSSVPMVHESQDLVIGETKTAFGRRFGRHYKERVLELRESMSRYALPVVSGRSRRLSQPHKPEYTEPAKPTGLDISNTLRPPTSPPKRTARQGDERPRKYRNALFPIGDRKDTPAPPAFGLPVRPASSRNNPIVISASGGDSARKAAAFHNFTTNSAIVNANPSTFHHQPHQWGPLDRVIETEDIHTRRRRVGSLSSAADSGADLSTYSGSEQSVRDADGDVDMCADETSPLFAATYDFVKSFPHELSLSIFQLLDASDIVRAEGVSRTWYALAQDMQVWRTVFLRKYQRRVLTDPPPIQVGGIGVGRVNRPSQEWRKMFKARRQLDDNWRAGAANAGKAIYLSGHTDSVYCLQFDEEKIITGSRDRTIRVWDINTFQCLRVIGGPNVKPASGPKVLRTVDYPSFHMATASVNGTAYGDGIFHVPSEWHDASILCLQYDSEILVTGSSDSDLLIWDIKTYEPIRRLKRHNGGVLDVALDAKHIVSCSKDSKIIVWDRQTFEAKGELTGHKGPVNAVQLRGHLLVSASGDGIARLWDLNQMRLIKEFSAKERGLAAVEFSEDMKYVLAGGNDNITYKFETETGREVMQFTGHSQLVRSLWLDSANNRVVSGSYDLDLRVYDFENGQELWRGEEWTTSWMLAAKSDYRRIVATSQDGRILIVDFGILKGLPNYQSSDGQPIENIDLLRGTDHTTAIQFRNPFESSSTISASFAPAAAPTSSLLTAAPRSSRAPF